MQTSDELHTMALGVDQRYVGHVLWKALLANVYNVSQTSKAEMAQAGVLKMRAELSEYYKRLHRLHPGRLLSKVDKITVKMLGKKSSPCLAAKGGESSDLVEYAVQICDRHASTNAFFSVMAVAGKALMEARCIFGNYSRNLPRNVYLDLVDCCRRFLCTYKAARCHMVPKCHDYMHLCLAAGRSGNPRTTSSWYLRGLDANKGNMRATRLEWHSYIYIYI
jgi:hypothetical protein